MGAHLLQHGRPDATDRVQVFQPMEDGLAGVLGQLLLTILDDAVGQTLAHTWQEAQLGDGRGIGIERINDLVGEGAGGREVIGDRAGRR